MTIVAGASTISTERLDLVWLSPEIVGGLLDRALAELDGVAISHVWVAENDGLLRLRHRQAEADPTQALWLLRAIVERASRALVGHIGFHGAPGVNALAAEDAVELGYTVEPAHRRLGYAREAVLGMMEWARGEHGIRRFLASVSPSNEPSLGLVRKLGFVPIARVQDDGGGEEIVFELVQE